jgi:hypothetical protein
MREALKGVIDTRFWCSYGTVCVIDDAGNVSVTDEEAVIVAADGVYADVLLEPSGIPTTCRVQLGVGGNSCTIFCPIRAGDEVLVTLPNGDTGMPPLIVAVLNNKTAKLPMEPNKQPVFKNDRLSIFAKDVPIEIRNAAGASARLETDGTVVVIPAPTKQVLLGDSTGTQPVGLGAAIETYLGKIRAFLVAHTHPVSGTTASASLTNIDAVPGVQSPNVQVKT